MREHEPVAQALAETPVIVRQICFEPLHACNLRCLNCYVGDDIVQAKPAITSYEDLLPVLTKVAQLSLEVEIVGGEPTLHPDFLSILRFLKTQGAKANGTRSVGFSTNGARVTEAMAQEIKALGCWANLSFRGDNRETFDYLAGRKGAFDMALKAAITLSNAGVDLGIAFNATPYTYDQLGSTLAMLEKEGVKIGSVMILRIYDKDVFAASKPDRASADYPEDEAYQFLLSPHQWNVLLAEALEIKTAKNLRVTLDDDLPLCLLDERLHAFVTQFAAEESVLRISPYGEVWRYFCTNKVVGDLRTDTLEEVTLRLQNGAGKAPLSLPAVCYQCSKQNLCLGEWAADGGERLNHPWHGYEDVLKPFAA